VPDTTSLDDYDAGSPEAAEWRDIRARNVEEFRRRNTHDRFDRARPVALADLKGDAEQLMREVDRHLDLVATLTTSGWLLFPDVSEHQGAFNWQWCKDAGMKVAAYKGTEGRTYVDGQQARNRDTIRALGLTGMVYGFVYWSAEYDSNPALWNEQGKWFAQHAPDDFAHAIDVEMLCTGKSTDVARVVAGYRSVYPHHPLMIYTNRSLYASRSKGTPANPSTLGLLEWHAGITNGAYTSATGSLPTEWGGISTLTNSLTGFPPEVVWQFTDHGAVAGLSVDGNGYKGTLDSFRRAFITGGESDDMSQADVDAILAGLKAQLAGVPAAVWNHPVGSAWEDDPAQSAGKALRSAQRYSIEAGFVGNRPGTTTPTAASSLSTTAGGAATAEGLRSVASSATAQRQAIAAQLDPTTFAQAFIDKLGGAGGTLTQEQVREAASEAFAEQLGQVRLGVIDPPASSPGSSAGEG
jgi:hypothetical protein